LGFSIIRPIEKEVQLAKAARRGILAMSFVSSMLLPTIFLGGLKAHGRMQ
jgi:hypothetical protein